MALKKLKAWKIINGVQPVTPDFYDDDATAQDDACQEWLLETFEEKEVTPQKVTANHDRWRQGGKDRRLRRSPAVELLGSHPRGTERLGHFCLSDSRLSLWW